MRVSEEEDDAFKEYPKDIDQGLQFCLVGTCLTESVVHFPSLRNTLADIWHLIVGVTISELGEKRYLFKFLLLVDIQRVLSGMPWFFNNHLLLLYELKLSDDPLLVELNHIVIWV